MTEPTAPFTVFTSTGGELAKTFGFKEGKVTKEAPGTLASGTYEIVTKSLPELKKSFLNADGHKWCICLGTPSKHKGRITTKKRHNKEGHPADPIPRTKEYFKFREQPTLCLIDIDGIEKPIESILADLEKVIPGFVDAGRLVVFSSSSGLMHEGTLVKESTSCHLYLIVKDGTDTPRFMEMLFDRLWLAGLGHITISAAGAMLTRAIIDKTVAAPERIIYEAPPILKDGLTQKRPEPELKEGAVLDTKLLPDLNEDERAKLEARINDAKAAKAPDAEQITKAYTSNQAAKIAKEQGITLNEAEKVVKSRLKRVLADEDVLYFAEKPDGITVKAVLESGQKWNGKSLADPLEPDYDGGSLTKAKFYFNDGKKPIIHSHAHGSIKYSFKRYEEEPVWSFEDAYYYVSLPPCDEPAGHREVVKDILSHNAFDSLEADALRTLIKKHFGINKGAQDKAEKEVRPKQIEGEALTDERTHSQLCADFCETSLPKDKAKIVGAEDSLWEFNDETGLFREKDKDSIAAEIGDKYKGDNCRKGGDYKSIANLVYNRMKNETFFSDAPYGVPAKSEFIRVTGQGIGREPYSPYHRQRYKLDVDPDTTGRNAPLFAKYLHDTFEGKNSEEDIRMFQEIMGGLVAGCFNKLQRAVLLIGSGSNGKSVFLELLGAMFPPSMVAAVPPALFESEYYKAELAGKAINIVGELEKTKALNTAAFKDIIGCDTPLTARWAYGRPFKYKPVAAHIFASNHFPTTKDHSHGFYRRWVCVNFKNTVAEKKKIPNLGARIAAEEMPAVLAWALEGAERLIKNNYKLTLTESHKKALEKWQYTKDSVFCFLNDDEAVVRTKGARTTNGEAYEAYRAWTGLQGVHPVGKHEFLDRARILFQAVKYAGESRSLLDLALVPAAYSCFTHS